MNLIKGIKAKFRDKQNMPKWYDERIDICNKCKNNSKNSTTLSLKDKLRISHNFGKDACLICSCGIKDIASDPTIKCSAKLPKWDWVQTPNFDIKFNLENFSPSSGKLTKDGKYYFYDFGNINFKTDVTAKLLFVVKDELKYFKVISSCGCTKPNFTKNKKGYLIEVSYDTSNIGIFEKQISIIFLNNQNIKEYLTFWIKGNVNVT